jgi:hypothetical protein
VHCGTSCNSHGCLPRIRRSSAADVNGEKFTVSCTSSETRLRYGVDLYTVTPTTTQCNTGVSLYGTVNGDYETLPMTLSVMQHLNSVFGNPVGAVASKAPTSLLGTLGQPGTGPAYGQGSAGYMGSAGGGGTGGGCGALGCDP